MNHSLKTLPGYFEAVYNMDKTFEVRKNDRGFELDDGLYLREWDAEESMFTGRQIGARITYILDDPDYCKGGYVILGFELGAASMQYDSGYILRKGTK